MKLLSEITPSIRVAHHYQFRSGEHFSENRSGYCYAFHLFDGGRGKVRVGNRLYAVTKGALFWLHPEQVHSFYPDPTQPFSSFNIYCELWKSPALATHKHLAWNPSEFDNSLLTPTLECPELTSLPSVIHLQQYPLLQDWFAHIVKLHGELTEPYREEKKRSLLYAWMLELYGACLLVDNYDPRIQEMMDRVEIDPDVNYMELLQRSGMRKTQFHDLFKKMSGLPPKGYIQKIKMKQAALELVESSRSISQISEALGYSSIHYFTKRFTAYYGIPPSAYRHGLRK